jgi:hypothetical protein
LPIETLSESPPRTTYHLKKVKASARFSILPVYIKSLTQKLNRPHSGGNARLTRHFNSGGVNSAMYVTGIIIKTLISSGLLPYRLTIKSIELKAAAANQQQTG